jgi:hypothetical protein
VLKKELLVGLAIVMIVSGFVSLLASAHPDGLEYVAEETGFDHAATQTLNAPIPDYVFPGLSSEAAATAAAGLVGSALVFVFAWGLGRVIRGRTG